MAIEEHTLGEGYSSHHKIPTVSEFRDIQKKRYDESDERARKLSQQVAEDYDDTEAYDSTKAGTSTNNTGSATTGGAAPNYSQTGDSAGPANQTGDSPVAPPSSASKGAKEGKDDGTEEEDISKIPREDGPKSGKEEKEEAMKKAQSAGKKSNKIEYKGERIVRDPVTGEDVIVKDAEEDSYDIDRLDPKVKDKTGPSLAPPPRNANAYDTLHTSPKPASPTNILLQPYPAPVEASTFQSIRGTLDTIALGVGAGCAIIWFLVAFRAGFWAFAIRTTLLGTLAGGTFLACGHFAKKLETDVERARAEMHRKRGLSHTPPVPESAEWLNAMMAVVWPLIDPSMFASVVDMVEDIMQASLPKFVDAIRISDLGLGTNPFRIVAIRGLPDQQTDKDYPKEEWIYRATPKESQMPDDDWAPDSRKSQKQSNGQNSSGSKSSNIGDVDGEKEEQNKRDKAVATKQDMPETSMNDVDKSEEELDQAGDYVNYEISMVYQARPGTSVGSRASNIHLLIQFFLGAYDWFHVPIPIWIQFEGLVVTARVRLQMVPQPPYIRNLTFTLMGVPKVQLSAIPMAKMLPNVLDLPLISGFVQSSVAAAANEYVAPKSMTLNMASILTGDGIKKDTLALGIFVITLHHAEDLSAQDSNGKSDPYIVLSYAKFGKPLYSTRIISGDLNPVWEETAVLLCSSDEVKAGESLSIQLWDNDKMSADDLVGRIQIPLPEIMSKPGQTQRRTDKLMGFEDASEMSGTLTWSVAYYEKAKLDRSLKTEKGTAENQPKEIQKDGTEQQPTPADTKEEADALHVPPRKDLKSGVLSVIVHQISQLERQNLKGASGKTAKREGAAGQDTDAPEEEGPNLPNSYCEIYVNDNMVYKTRTKMYTSMPFFEAGTEVFIRDWTTATVRVAVRDARLREHDPLLGIVTMKLTDVLAGSSQNTLTASLQEGVGFGRANISVLFKGVEAKLPKNMLGWETSTIELLSDITLDSSDVENDYQTKKLTLHTNDGRQKISSKLATVESGKVTWDIGDEDIRMPIYNRFNNALYFELGGTNPLNPLDNTPDAIAVLWLRDLVDDEEKSIRIPVIKGDNMNLLKQNYLNEQMLKTHPHKVVGHITCTVRLDPGLDPDHEGIAQNTNAARHGFEVYDHLEGQAKVAEKNSHAMDDGVIDKKEQKSLDKAHKKALESRHRGKMQLSAVRTMVWMKDGLKARKNALKGKLPGQETTKEPQIQSEV